MMANKLLSLHMDTAKEQHQIQEIVDNLTSKLYYHGHPINRVEGEKHVGIKTIAKANEKIENLIWELYLQYEEEMKLQTPFMPVYDFIQKYPSLQSGQTSKTPKDVAKLVYIESLYKTDVNILEYEILGNMAPNGVINTQVLTLFQGWKTE